MTDEQKKEIVELRKQGVTYRAIAELTGLPEGSVNCFMSREVLKNTPKCEETHTAEEILKQLRKGIPKRDCDAQVIEIIEKLGMDGYNITSHSGEYVLSKAMERAENIVHEDWNGETIIKFGAIGDTHIGNKYQQISYLNEFYDRCQREGIDTIYHAGDISDGYYTNRNEQIYELFVHGFDEQKNYIVENYPQRDGMVTKFILGNHDFTHIRNGGANIGIPIAIEREDMIFLGVSTAKVNLTPNCVMEVNHPGDGSAYSISYSMQKLMESYSGQEKPDILLNGHHHKALYMFYRNIHGIEIGCFQAQTPFMKGKKLRADMGGYIVTIKVDDSGIIKSFGTEFIPIYYALKNDY